MENKEKQIEEMAEILAGDCGDCSNCEYDNDVKGCCFKNAERIYNAGYRKERQGEWKPIMQELNCCDTLECSICEFVIDISQGDYNYCPNCGAKMKGAE